MANNVDSTTLDLVHRSILNEARQSIKRLVFREDDMVYARKTVEKIERLLNE